MDKYNLLELTIMFNIKCTKEKKEMINVHFKCGKSFSAWEHWRVSPSVSNYTKF